MQFADPQSVSTAYLILRHLYDGDIIEWPVPQDHPQCGIFAGLEQQGYVARWDRVWPLSDRYRLTEKGIATIEAVYRPAGSESFWDDLRRRNLPPADRRAYLQSQRLDPFLWPLLHDPSTHWSTFGSMGGRYTSYIWEDQRPPRLLRSHRRKMMKGGGGGGIVRGPRVVHHVVHHHHDPRPIHHVDLDDRAGQDPGAIAPDRPDYDVS
jgi:hypothetical protein